MARRRTLLPPRPRIQCRGCGARFAPKRSNQVYCGSECRKQNYKEKYYSPPKVTKVCPWCGEEFETSAPQKTMYCPEKGCQREAAKDRLNEMRRDYKRLKELEQQGRLPGG